MYIQEIDDLKNIVESAFLLPVYKTKSGKAKDIFINSPK